MRTEDRSTQPVNFIRFHGISILVVSHTTGDYIDFKQLVDGIGLDWRTQKVAIQTEENAEIYGMNVLFPPNSAGVGGASPPKERIFIRLDRAHFFIARISLAQLRARGNHKVADYLMRLYTEWATALHAYETHGIAVKSGRSNGFKDVHQLVRTRDLLKDPRERAVFTQLLHQELAAIGLPIDTFDGPQQQLPLGAEVRHG